MICKHCGKRLVATTWWQHEGEGFQWSAANVNAAAAAPMYTMTTHMIEPVPDPNPPNPAVGGSLG